MAFTPDAPGTEPSADDILARLEPGPGEDQAGYIKKDDLQYAWEAFLSLLTNQGNLLGSVDTATKDALARIVALEQASPGGSGTGLVTTPSAGALPAGSDGDIVLALDTGQFFKNTSGQWSAVGVDLVGLQGDVAGLQQSDQTQSTTLATHGTDIAALQASLATALQDIADLKTAGGTSPDLTALETRVGSLESNFTTLTSTVGGHGQSIQSLEGRVTNLEAAGGGGAGSGAVITAQDSLTGQLQIEGVEMGDTGWIPLSSHQDWAGVNFNLLYLRLRRYGDLVQVEGYAFPKADLAVPDWKGIAQTLLTLPEGFRATGDRYLTFPSIVLDTGQAGVGGSAGWPMKVWVKQSGDISFGGLAGLVESNLPSTLTTQSRWIVNVTYMTADPWPTTL